MVSMRAGKRFPFSKLAMLFFFAGCGAAAGNDSSPSGSIQEVIDQEMVQAIIDEGTHRSHVQQDLRYLTDVIGPRLTGSPAMEKASQWTVSKMREYGLNEVHLEEWPFGRGWEQLFYAGHMTSPFLKPLHGKSLAWSGSTNGSQSGEAIFLDPLNLEALSDAGDQVRGKWILVHRAEEDRFYVIKRTPPSWSDEQVLEREVEVAMTAAERQQEGERHERDFAIRSRLAELGANGIVQRSIFHNGVLGPTESILGEIIPPEVLKAGGISALPNLVLSDLDYSLVYRNVVAGVKTVLEFDIRNRYIEDHPVSHNTIGEIPGTDLRDEFVMIGAHLDSWVAGTGATDDAAGSIVALEAMRILSAVNARPRRTIRIGLWGGEEPERPYSMGLYGSSAFVKDHAEELQRTSVYFNLDQGAGRIRGIWEQDHPAAAGIIEQIMRPFESLGVVGMKPGFFVGSDEKSFAAMGVPAFPFVHDHPVQVYHTDADTYDFIEIEDLKQAAIIVAATAYHLAVRDELLPRKP